MHKQALCAAALTAIAWGLTGIFVVVLPPVSAFYISGGRLLIGLLCVLPCLLLSASARSAFLGAARRPIAYIFAGLLTLYYLTATSGFQNAPVAEIALLLCVAPIFVLLLRRLRGDIPTRREVGGAVLALIGLAWILAPRLLSGSSSEHDHHLLGDLLAITAAACTALYADAYARLNKRGAAPSPLGTTILTLLVGSISLLILAGIWAEPLPAAVFSDKTLWQLLGLGVLCTGVPSLCFAFASQHLPPLVTATISLLIPVFAALFAALFLAQVLPLSMLPGSLVLLAGVALVLYGSKAAPSPVNVGE